MKPFASVCVYCGEPVIRDGTGCPCKCHETSFKYYLKLKSEKQNNSTVSKE